MCFTLLIDENEKMESTKGNFRDHRHIIMINNISKERKVGETDKHLQILPENIFFLSAYLSTLIATKCGMPLWLANIAV